MKSPRILVSFMLLFVIGGAGGPGLTNKLRVAHVWIFRHGIAQPSTVRFQRPDKCNGATPEGTLSYTYYPTGKVETINSSNPHGAWVGYTWDDQNRLGTVVDGRLSGQNTTTYTYDPSSNLATAACPLPAVKLPARMAPRTGWVAHVWIFRHGRPWLWAVLFPSTLV
jgi:hypothetical protein